jgi:hypothetical protein
MPALAPFHYDDILIQSFPGILKRVVYQVIVLAGIIMWIEHVGSDIHKPGYNGITNKSIAYSYIINEKITRGFELCNLNGLTSTATNFIVRHKIHPAANDPYVLKVWSKQD